MFGMQNGFLKLIKSDYLVLSLPATKRFVVCGKHY
jgi:hypothetical protein